MVFNLISLYKICKEPEQLLRMLRVWGLIPADGVYRCPKCSGFMKISRQLDRIDGLQWYCGNQWQKKSKGKFARCSNRVELRTGTFFANSKLTLFQILGFVNLWCEGAPLRLICGQIEIARKTAIDWASFCREVCLDVFISREDKLGGPGIIVEIDESKFGKRKYHRGRRVEGQWVFGGYERGTGRIFMVCVENRGADTLIPIISNRIAPGTTIISDFWKAYDCLGRNGYEHLKVNHSLNFKDPETGAHTNAIEASWRAAKATMSSSGRRKAHIPGNLARYMFFKSCQELDMDRSEEFLKLAGELYNPLISGEDRQVLNEVPIEDLDDD